ncbi:hypothetical protein WA026_013693 [Henosepilachna vigintioctopunctata]|uniref:Cilia- and flagella-associated protein 91 n=1 Tax=Henosepilachna vigintioctopunctata TaxID=420089 RepID=A0AAW1UQM7_9CUCU
MERDEWAFREQEIQEIQELRMKLLEEMLAELHEKSLHRNDMKLRNMAEIKKTETTEKIQKLRKNTERELRKLEMKHRGLNPKYHPTDIVDDHAHPKSELYAPLMRHGEHPMRWHQVMDERLKYYKAQFIGVEEFSTLPKWLNKATILKDDYNTIKLPGTRICMRATKWTTPVLKKLHEELKNLRKTSKRKCTLRVRIEKTVSEASTPETSELADTEEDKYQSLIAIQSMLKGRSSQMLIYEGRDKCRELIKELKYSTGLLEEESEGIGRTRKRIKQQHRQEALQSTRVAKLHRSLNKLEGSIVGSLLDFLNKELRRLLDERRAHAICFLNERERNDREAAEAGRRQKELRRRREHDEIFKQMVKVHQDTVDIRSNVLCEKFIDKIEDDNADNLEKSIDVTEQEETIADLVHHFVLPEVQKQLVRQRIKKKQKENLRKINDTLLDDLMEELPNMKLDDAIGAEDELPDTGFKFKYQSDKEIMENLWGNEEEYSISNELGAEEGEERSSESINQGGFKHLRSSREEIDVDKADEVKYEDSYTDSSQDVIQLIESSEFLKVKDETHTSLEIEDPELLREEIQEIIDFETEEEPKSIENKEEDHIAEQSDEAERIINIDNIDQEE